LTAQTPDEQLAKAKEVIDKFADSDYRGTAFFVMTLASEKKQDYDNVVVYGEQAIAADPLNYGSMALIAKAIALSTKKFDLDKAEKLARVEKLAKDTVELSAKAVKPSDKVTDEQFKAVVAEIVEPAYEGLGFADMVKEDFNACADHFKLASSSLSAPDTILLARAANCYRLGKRYDEAIATFDQVLADAHSIDAVKNYATQGKNQAIRAKAAAAAAK